MTLFGDTPRFGKRGVGGCLLGDVFVDILPQTSPNVGPGSYTGKVVKTASKRSSTPQGKEQTVNKSFLTFARRPDSNMLAQAVIRDDVLIMHKRPSTPGPGMYAHLYDRSSPWVTRSFNIRVRSGNSPVRRDPVGGSSSRPSSPYRGAAPSRQTPSSPARFAASGGSSMSRPQYSSSWAAGGMVVTPTRRLQAQRAAASSAERRASASSRLRRRSGPTAHITAAAAVSEAMLQQPLGGNLAELAMEWTPLGEEAHQGVGVGEYDLMDEGHSSLEHRKVQLSPHAAHILDH